jgi:hypothetical protein
MKCHRCGTLNFMNIRYCSKCQTEINPASNYRQVIERPEPFKLCRFAYMAVVIGLIVTFGKNLNLDDWLTDEIQTPSQSTEQKKTSQPALTAPQRRGEQLLIQQKAREAYRNVYQKAVKHKAFAQADNGIWAYRYGHTTQKSAIETALKKCRDYSRGKACKIVNVNDEWYP